MSQQVIVIWEDKFGRKITRYGGYITFHGIGHPFDIEDDTMREIVTAWEATLPDRTEQPAPTTTEQI